MAVYQAEVRFNPHSHMTVNADFLARLRRGRPPYPRAPIIEAANSAIKKGADLSLNTFCDRVRGLLEADGFLAPKRTVIEKICRPIYQRALSVKK
jgi:hypothetical protein